MAAPTAPCQVEILNQTTDAIVALDSTGCIVLWNRAAERVFQRLANDVLGKRPREVHVYPWLAPEDEQEAVLAVRRTGVWRGEAVRHTGNGKASYLESTITALMGADGNAIGLLAVIRDTTAAKRRELEHEECIERLRHLTERLKTIAGVIPICAHCKRIRDENASWQEIETYIGERLGTSGARTGRT